ncbi:MAG: ribonucleotide reductase subunit alpha [Burkholderiaceae bacterium]
MDIEHFDDLLAEAGRQADAQRLLLVFVGVELPEDSTAEQRADFEAGHGGALAPRMAVDKSPDEIASFAALTEEAADYDNDWRFVMTAAMSGQGARPPSDEAVAKALERMVEDVHLGRFDALLPFDRQGVPVRIG